MKPYQIIFMIYGVLGIIVGIISVMHIFKEENKHVRNKLDLTFWGSLTMSFFYHAILWPIVLLK